MLAARKQAPAHDPKEWMSTPAAASDCRTATAISTAPGESPCTQIESALTLTSVPSGSTTDRS